MIVAIVLSAGESSRMGSPKALLPIDGKTFIEAIVASLKKTRVDKIIVVLGHNGEELRPKVESLGVTVVMNPDYKKGQLSSLIAAVRSIESAPAAILIHLVDHPYINPSLVDKMIDRFYESNKLIVVPTYKGKRGHPVLLSAKLFPELLAAPLDQGAKAVVRTHSKDTLELDTDDEGILIDIDTPDEYQKHLRTK